LVLVRKILFWLLGLVVIGGLGVGLVAVYKEYQRESDKVAAKEAAIAAALFLHCDDYFIELANYRDDSASSVEWLRIAKVETLNTALEKPRFTSPDYSEVGQGTSGKSSWDRHEDKVRIRNSVSGPLCAEYHCEPMTEYYEIDRVTMELSWRTKKKENWKEGDYAFALVCKDDCYDEHASQCSELSFDSFEKLKLDVQRDAERKSKNKI
jgi:hypothetical protein